jgi:hypothetical protein
MRKCQECIYADLHPDSRSVSRVIICSVRSSWHNERGCEMFITTSESQQYNIYNGQDKKGWNDLQYKFKERQVQAPGPGNSSSTGQAPAVAMASRSYSSGCFTGCECRAPLD